MEIEEMKVGIPHSEDLDQWDPETNQVSYRGRK